MADAASASSRAPVVWCAVVDATSHHGTTSPRRITTATSAAMPSTSCSPTVCISDLPTRRSGGISETRLQRNPARSTRKNATIAMVTWPCSAHAGMRAPASAVGGTCRWRMEAPRKSCPQSDSSASVVSMRTERARWMAVSARCHAPLTTKAETMAVAKTSCPSMPCTSASVVLGARSFASMLAVTFPVTRRPPRTPWPITIRTSTVMRARARRGVPVRQAMDA